MEDNIDFSGMWRCTYWYPSNKRPGEQETSECYCNAKQTGDKLVVESLPDPEGHYMVTNLTIDHGLATGQWVEDTKPQGEFEGLQYSGAVQLLVSDDGSRMVGAWVGIGREKLDDGTFEPRIYNGKFELVRAGNRAATRP